MSSVDIRMPKMDGVIATKKIKQLYPDIKIIILTTFDDDEFVYSALKYGASGYLLKWVSMENLHKAIQTVYKGGSMINPDIATRVVTLFSKMAQSNYSIEVDEELTREISNTEWKVISKSLVVFLIKKYQPISSFLEGTVRNYLSSIFIKLNLRDRTQLAVWAVQTGVLMGKFQR